MFDNCYYYSANKFFKEKFKSKIIKIAVDGGFTCPNRDGTLDSSGCIFCSEKGSGDFSGNRADSITKQFEYMKNKMSNKWSDGKYLIYFQAFTNTYAPIEELKRKYYEAISLKDVVGISIATRPDCINTEIAELLNEINKTKYVLVELGFQTSNEKSVQLINRRYENIVFDNAVKILKSYNIDVISHIIIGIPHENKTDIINSVKYVSDRNINGIKLQLLHVLRNTKLEIMYKENPFKIFSLEEYADLIVSCIEIIPKNIVIHRITGDGSKDLLIAPLWSLNKKNVLNTINREFKLRNTYQGKNCI